MPTNNTERRTTTSISPTSNPTKTATFAVPKKAASIKPLATAANDLNRTIPQNRSIKNREAAIDESGLAPLRRGQLGSGPSNA